MRFLLVLFAVLLLVAATPPSASCADEDAPKAAEGSGAEGSDTEKERSSPEASGEKESAGEAHGGNSNPLSVDPDLAIATLIVFLLLLGILRLLAWGPISEGLNKREQSIADQIDEANQSNEKAQAMLQQYEQKMAAAQEEIRTMLADGKKEAEASKEAIIAEAKETAQRERERTVEEIRLAKEAAVSELAQTVVNNAVALTGRMLHREVDSSAHADLISEAMDKFPSQN